MGAFAICGCQKVASPCKRLATQEDLLCDVCRGGCDLMMKIDPEHLDETIVEPHGSDAIMEQWLAEGFPDRN